MRTSIVNHPSDEPLIIIRHWQSVFCDGNEVAAALLSFFEYWHNIKIDMASQNRKVNEVAQQYGDAQTADTSLYQWHTEAELISGIERIAKTGKTLTKAIDFLVNKGVITVHKNPNPSYKFDKKRYFLFYPEVVNTWLAQDYRSSKNTSSSSKKTLPSSKNASAITETTPETTPDINGSAQKSENQKTQHAQIERQALNKLGKVIGHDLNIGQVTTDELRAITLIGADIAKITKSDILAVDLAEIRALAGLTIRLSAKENITTKLKSFNAWWYNVYWLGKDKGQPPSIKQMGSTWGQFEASTQVSSNGSGPNLTEEQKARLAELTALDAQK